ncbi:hypothetical protein CB1_092500002 [Camelus ferus]|nr:hypothetical protein CB1_092500002 [Camelus ferus]
MATLNASSTSGITPSHGHNAPSPPPDTSSPSTPSDPVTTDPAALSTSESMRASELGAFPWRQAVASSNQRRQGAPRRAWLWGLPIKGPEEAQAFVGHTQSHGVTLAPAQHQGLLGNPATFRDGGFQAGLRGGQESPPEAVLPPSSGPGAQGQIVMAVPGGAGGARTPAPGRGCAHPPTRELFQYFRPQALGQLQASLPGPGLRPDKPLEAQLLLNGFHHLGAPACKVFCCLVCQAFSTDGLELLLCHCSVGGSLLGAEWKKVAGDTHRCKLCCYGTQLKANLQLHLKTDKHAQKYQTHSDSQAQRHLQLLLSGPTASEVFSAPQGTLRFSHGRLQVPGKAPIIPSAEPPTPEKDAQNKPEQLASEGAENKTGPPGDSSN